MSIDRSAVGETGRATAWCSLTLTSRGWDANVTESGFAKMLDRAIEVRDKNVMNLIEAKLEPVESEAQFEPKPVEQQHDASELKGPMSQLRKW